MKRKAWVIGFGTVLAVIGLFGVLQPKPEPTAFEKGYGLRLMKEERSLAGAAIVVKRSFASPEDYGALVMRIESENKPGSLQPSYGFATGSNPEGTIAIQVKEMVLERLPWPSDARSFLRTTAIVKPNLLQRMTLALGFPI